MSVCNFSRTQRQSVWNDLCKIKFAMLFSWISATHVKHVLYSQLPQFWEQDPGWKITHFYFKCAHSGNFGTMMEPLGIHSKAPQNSQCCILVNVLGTVRFNCVMVDTHAQHPLLFLNSRLPPVHPQNTLILCDTHTLTQKGVNDPDLWLW